MMVMMMIWRASEKLLFSSYRVVAVVMESVWRGKGKEGICAWRNLRLGYVTACLRCLDSVHISSVLPFLFSFPFSMELVSLCGCGWL